MAEPESESEPWVVSSRVFHCGMAVRRGWPCVAVTLALARGASAQTPHCTAEHRCVTTFASVGDLDNDHLLAAGSELYFATRGKVMTILASGTPMIAAGTWLFSCVSTRRINPVGDFALTTAGLFWATEGSVCRTSIPASAPVTLLVDEGPGARVDSLAMGNGWMAYAVRFSSTRYEVHILFAGQTTPRVVASAGDVVRLATDGTSLFWIDQASVYRAEPVTVGHISLVGPPRIIGSVTHAPTSFAIDHGILYVATSREIMRMRPGASLWTTIANDGADQFAVDGGDVYSVSMRRGTVAKTSIATGVTTVLVSHVRPRGVTTDATSVLFVDEYGDSSPTSALVKQIVPK